MVDNAVVDAKSDGVVSQTESILTQLERLAPAEQEAFWQRVEARNAERKQANAKRITELESVIAQATAEIRALGGRKHGGKGGTKAPATTDYTWPIVMLSSDGKLATIKETNHPQHTFEVVQYKTRQAVAQAYFNAESLVDSVGNVSGLANKLGKAGMPSSK